MLFQNPLYILLGLILGLSVFVGGIFLFLIGVGMWPWKDILLVLNKKCFTATVVILIFTSLGEKEYEEGPMAGKKLPKPVQLLGFLLTGATVVSIIIIISIMIMIGIDIIIRISIRNYFVLQ